MNIAIIAITPGGAALARRLDGSLPGAEVHLPERFRQDDRCRYFREPLAEVLPRLFAEGRPLVCVMAAGIAVRLLAPHLQGKSVDPAVVVMDERGAFAVSLLSGHLGGANALARQLAALSGGQAVVTTATDVNGLPAWDEVARQEGMTIEPLAAIRTLNRLLLEGGKILLADEGGLLGDRYEGVAGVRRIATVEEALRGDAEGKVLVTHHLRSEGEGADNVLFLRPRNLAVGIGCNRGTSAEEIEKTVFSELERAGLSPRSIACLATVEAKRDEAGLLRFAEAHGLPLAFYSAEELNRVEAPSADSPHALAAVGARGVSEPAAILASGGGPFLLPKVKRGNVTVAVAERP
ncbi:cobalt-precorrin 5A hydrolase [uncultured Desulfuromonas sp.]|uniref:cobalt-precorrin 5A hydrolase n=1 Tax=uncultured Desulfuromonas sp. TaxID=181013 RepID=UPI00262FCF7C|nr:cobalt-precorrin 5A hydrolase [uncultured Desulfuromonas sp.]